MIPQMRPATDVHGCGIHAQHIYPKKAKLEVLPLTRPDELSIILPMFIAQTLSFIGYLIALVLRNKSIFFLTLFHVYGVLHK